MCELHEVEKLAGLQARIRKLCGKGRLEGYKVQLLPKPAGSPGRSPRWFIVSPTRELHSPTHPPARAPRAPKRRGRPPGSKNRPRVPGEIEAKPAATVRKAMRIASGDRVWIKQHSKHPELVGSIGQVRGLGVKYVHVRVGGHEYACEPDGLGKV